MELNTITLADFVRNAEILFLKGLDAVNMANRGSGMWQEDPVPQNTGDVREYTEIDLEEYAKRKLEGDQANRAKVQQGFTKIARLERTALDIGITHEMRTRNKYTTVVARLTNLGKLAAKRMELDLSHRFTFGTDISFLNMDGETVDITTGDGLSLFNTAHLVRGSAVTFRNRLASNPAFLTIK